MLFDWWRQRKRRKALRGATPEGWVGYIEQNVASYDGLSEAQQRRLIDDTRVFVATRRFEAARGFQITDEVKVTIAAQACLLTLGFDDLPVPFPRVKTVVVLGTHYDLVEVRGGQMEGTRVLGHTNMYGPVYLAWDWVRHGGRDPRDGRNLVYHEFAHKLDLADGVGDGTPVIDDRAAFGTWVEVMTEAYERHVERTEDGRRTLLDAYGTTNPAEFFAVATECFFEKPRQMRQRHEALYGVLRRYYRQDPAARAGR